MSWERRYFKGKKVWVQLDESGELKVEDGRVPMQYSRREGARTYLASPRNISGPTDEAGSPAPKKTRRRGTKSPDQQIQLDVGEPWESDSLPEALADYAAPAPGVVEIYTDGACSGNPGPCGFGWLKRFGDAYHEKCQFLGRGTNNIAELTAIKSALESVDDRTRPVRVHTDSSYSIGVLTKGWKAKANRELILSIRELIKGFDDLDFIKVRGHAGHPLNERADELATSTIN